MKLFVRGGVGLFAALFAAFLIFYARPLIAETYPSQQPAPMEQQEKLVPAQEAQHKKEVEATETSKTEIASISGTVLPSSSDTSANSTETPIIPAAAPQIYSATSIVCVDAEQVGWGSAKAQSPQTRKSCLTARESTSMQVHTRVNTL